MLFIQKDDIVDTKSESCFFGKKLDCRGKMLVMRFHWLFLFASLGWLLISLPGGCAQPQPAPVLSDLESPILDTKVRAIKWAGDNRLESAVPLLVDRLQEQDTSVRFFAICALKKITGTDLDYDYKANAQQRAEAIQKWRAFLLEKNSSPPASGTNEDGK